jgi:fatty-acyl-CoA synthase
MHSYVSGVSEHPLIGETVGRFFDAVCDANPDRLALIDRSQRIRWTFSDLRKQVDALAAGLLNLGLEPGDRVGIWAPNRSEWLVTQYATAKAGLILVNINPAYRTAEAEYALNKVRCRALVLASRYKTSDYISMLQELAPELASSAAGHLRSQRLSSLQIVVTLGGSLHKGCLSFEDVLSLGTEADRQRLEEIGSQLQFDDPINIQFTSGTTGFPKGATLSHHNILNNAFFVGEAIQLQADDKLCIPVPLYHCFGMVMGNLGCLTHAACAIYPAEAFDPKAALETIDDEKCTAIYGVPTMYIAILNHPDFSRFDLTSLRTGIMAGSPCPIEIMRQVVDRLHLPHITIAYGMTETSPVSFQSSTGDSIERRVTSVGRIQPHLEAKIIDEEGHLLARGESGELCTRGYSVMLGYWDDPEQTNDVIDPNGWIHTGDVATLDEAGYCNIVGRLKDMVIRGGENIYPREIEEFLYRHPLIQDVQVIGVPDTRLGEELCAWIVVKSGGSLDEKTVRDFCSGQIAHFKIPRYVKFVDGFPTTVTGKVQKFVMREIMSAELGLLTQETA